MKNIKADNKNAGFTLIEMAIVLVIIGLIIGAVLKGQDLIQNARAKKFVNFVRAAEIGQWTYLDRKGHFNGDDGSVGIIDATGDYTWSGFSNKPETDLQLGSYGYSLFWGYENSTESGVSKNLIMVVPEGDVFTDDELVFLESLDTAIDGVSNGTDGRIQGSETAATGNGIFVPGTSSDFSASTKTVIYYFDKQ